MPSTSSKTRPMSVRLPVDVTIPDGVSPSTWLIEAARAYAGQPPRWKPLLGDALAERVAAVAPKDPGAFCLRAVTDAVRTAERKNRDASARDRRPAAPARAATRGAGPRRGRSAPSR